MEMKDNMHHLRDAAIELLQGDERAQDQAESHLLKDPNEGLQALLRVLENTDRPTKNDRLGRALLLLGALRSRDALPYLLSSFHNEALAAADLPYVIRAIAEIVDGRDAFDDRVQNVLDAASTHSNRYARAFAAKAYGQIGDARCQTRLTALLDDAQPVVKEYASTSLQRLNQATTTQPADDFAAFHALVEQSDADGGALKPWLDDLGNPNRKIRQAAIAELVKARQEAVPHLLDQLNQKDTIIRLSAATALGRIQPPEAVGPLMIAATTQAQSKEEHELRPVALRALAACLTGVEEGLSESLLPMTSDPDRFVRAGALLCLGRLAERQGMIAVVASLEDADPFVVESAAIALSEGVREDDVHLILPLLQIWDQLNQQNQSALREAILIALSRIQLSEAPYRVRIRHRVRHQLQAPTAAVRKAAIVLLEKLYQADDPPVLPVIDLVLAALSDPHPEVRLVAGSFLSQHLPPGVTHGVQELEQALARNEKPLSSLCLDALQRHDTNESRALLEATTFDEDTELASHAAALLTGFKPEHTIWCFTPKAERSGAAGRTESQRPTPSSTGRVRAVPKQGASSESDVVEARFTLRDGAPTTGSSPDQGKHS